MNGTWKPRAAGVIDLILGTIHVLIATLFLVGFIHDLVTVLLVLLIISPGVLSIIGGIFAIKREKWPVAFAGSVSAILCALAIPFVIGAATALTYIGSVADYQLDPVPMIVALCFCELSAVTALAFVLLSRTEFALR